MSTHRILGSTLLAIGTPAIPCTPITSVPITLTAPGTYCFTNDLLSAPDQTAITVNGDRITVDLKGYTLSGSDPTTGTGIAVASNRSDVLLRNGRISRFGTGVRATVALNLVVEDFEIGNVVSGISAIQGSHFSFRRNRVTGATGVGIGIGISLPLLTGSTTLAAMITDNEIVGVTATGQTPADVTGIHALSYATIIAGNRITGVRGGPASAAVRIGSASLLVANEFSETTGTAVCTSGSTTTKAIRNVTTNGQSGYPYCVSYDNF